MQEEKKFQKKINPKTLTWMLGYLKKHPKIIFLTVVFMLISDISSSLTPYFFKEGIDGGIAKKSEEILIQYALLMFISLTLSFIFSFIFNYQIQVLGQKIIYNIRMDVLKKTFSLEKKYFDNNPIGRTLTYLTADIEAIKTFISDGVVALLGNFLKILIITIIMFLINSQLALATMIVFPLFILLTWLFRMSLQRGYRGVRKSNSEINTTLIESITGIKEIILFNHKNKSKNNFRISNKNYLEYFLKIVHSYSLYFPLIEVASSVSMILVLYFTHLTINKSLTLGEVFAFFFYINMFFRPLRYLAEQLNTFEAAMSGAERICYFLKIKSSSKKKIQFKNTLDLQGDIIFKNVTFSYKKNEPLFNEFNLKVKQGEKIAILGSTGSGKTSLISLLTRLYEIDKGSISINKHPLKKIPLETLRNNISTIPQDVFLFTGNFYENIALGKNINPEDIEAAAKKIGLDEIIQKLPKKYLENVLEEGKSLSTGQKQLLSFCRSLIKDCPIVILDEATANIDSKSEKLIETGLKKMLETKTAFIIAHRLSTIQSVDRIIILKNGKIIEQGTSNELLKKKKYYYQFYKMQSNQLSY